MSRTMPIMAAILYLFFGDFERSNTSRVSYILPLRIVVSFNENSWIYTPLPFLVGGWDFFLSSKLTSSLTKCVESYRKCVLSDQSININIYFFYCTSAVECAWVYVCPRGAVLSPPQLDPLVLWYFTNGANVPRHMRKASSPTADKQRRRSFAVTNDEWLKCRYALCKLHIYLVWEIHAKEIVGPQINNISMDYSKPTELGALFCQISLWVS